MPRFSGPSSRRVVSEVHRAHQPAVVRHSSRSHVSVFLLELLNEVNRSPTCYKGGYQVQAPREGGEVLRVITFQTATTSLLTAPRAQELAHFCQSLTSHRQHRLESRIRLLLPYISAEKSARNGTKSSSPCPSRMQHLLVSSSG